jgi:carbonic anhydrase
MIYSDAKKSLSIDYYRRTYAFSVNERGIASKNATSYTKVQSLKRDLYRFHVHKESSHDFKSAATGTDTLDVHSKGARKRICHIRYIVLIIDCLF